MEGIRAGRTAAGQVVQTDNLMLGKQTARTASCEARRTHSLAAIQLTAIVHSRRC
jgi:hypothetical protein